MNDLIELEQNGIPMLIGRRVQVDRSQLLDQPGETFADAYGPDFRARQPDVADLAFVMPRADGVDLVDGRDFELLHPGSSDGAGCRFICWFMCGDLRRCP